MSITSDDIKNNGYIHPLADAAADEIEQLESRIAKLEAELADARKDQARYQWLRNNNGFNFNNEFDIGKFQVSQKKHKGEAWYLYLDELDQAIDAAIKEQQ